MSDDWRDQLAGARMQVDQQFQDRLEQSQFTNQEWGLIMTAVEFEIEQPGESERAELVANTSQLDQIVPELDRISQEMGGAMGASGSGSTGGIIGQFKDFLGGFSGSSTSESNQEQMAAATALVEEYAEQLQGYLEKRDRWEEIRTAAARHQ
ncbi:MAG: DUF5799 family protein [Haloarculaceae archaeon]